MFSWEGIWTPLFFKKNFSVDFKKGLSSHLFFGFMVFEGQKSLEWKAESCTGSVVVFFGAVAEGTRCSSNIIHTKSGMMLLLALWNPKKNWFSYKKNNSSWKQSVFYGEHDPNEGEDKKSTLDRCEFSGWRFLAGSTQLVGAGLQRWAFLIPQNKWREMNKYNWETHKMGENIMVHIKNQVFHNFSFWQKRSQFGTLELRKLPSQARRRRSATIEARTPMAFGWWFHPGNWGRFGKNPFWQAYFSRGLKPPPRDPAAFWLVTINI